MSSEITKSLLGWIFVRFFVSNTNWNIINEYDKVLHGSMYFNVQVFLQKVMLCLFSLSIIQFSCSCLVKMCQFNCRSTSSQTVPLSSFDIQEEQLNCFKILKRKTFLFLKFSIIISAIVEAERGENPFPNPLCARRGEKGGGWCGRAGFVTLWLIYQNQPRHTTFPLRYHSRTVPQYQSTTAEQNQSNTLMDLPEPAPSYPFPTTLPQQNSTTVPLWLIHQNQASVIPVLSRLLLYHCQFHTALPPSKYTDQQSKRPKQGSKTLVNLLEPAQHHTTFPLLYHRSISQFRTANSPSKFTNQQYKSPKHGSKTQKKTCMSLTSSKDRGRFSQLRNSLQCKCTAMFLLEVSDMCFSVIMSRFLKTKF